MPARRIFCLARTRRCAIASSLARNARATCAVVSPHTVRSVSATCTSAAKDGWQQMKISRSMSSSSALSLALPGADALSSNSCVSCACLPRNAMARRTRSIALLRATLTSQARGLDGRSLSAQRSSATAKASCRASSARSKSPTRRIRVAIARPASSRNIFSISPGVICLAAWSPGMTASPSVIDHDRPDLDRTRLGAGNAGGNAKRRVEILGFDQIVAAELLARLREWAIRGQHFAVADPHGGRGRRRLQAVAGLEMAALNDGLGERAVVRHHLLPIGSAHFAEFGFVPIDQQQILHLVTPSVWLDRRHPVERNQRQTTSSG